jgi:unsaturated chondroitin disaccharide hydrolase
MDINVFKEMPKITQTEVSQALKTAMIQVRRNLPKFTDACQNHSSINNFYPSCENNQWTCGFWSGEVWLAYEHTGDEVFRASGDSLVKSFLERIEQKNEVDHHDMGFLYTPSCIAAYKLTGNEEARKAALLAADQLISRFQAVGEFIQAWGRYGDKDNYRYIIDCLLNLPLLYWAEQETGHSRYKDIAHRHIATCLKYSIRPDGSTFHTVFIDPVTGKFVRGETCQGYRDDSSWARGQAWAVYGIALSYRYTGYAHYMDAFKRVLNYYLERLPSDLVPYWDLIFREGDEEPKDSSSASIVACGLLEMARFVTPQDAKIYKDLAKQMLHALWNGYSVKDPKISNGLVLHGTYSKKSPYNTCTPEGIDECVAWGDYFYLEALTRLQKEWNPYW